MTKTPSHTLAQLRPYRVLEARCQVIEEEVTQMLQEGFIEESTSLWSSSIIVVPKPNGNLWLCNNFRKLSAISEFNSHPLS